MERIPGESATEGITTQGLASTNCVTQNDSRRSHVRRRNSGRFHSAGMFSWRRRPAGVFAACEARKTAGETPAPQEHAHCAHVWRNERFSWKLNLAVATSACTRRLAGTRQPAEKCPHAIEESGWRRRRTIRRRRGRWSRRGQRSSGGMRGNRNRRGVHMAPKFNGRAQPHFADKQNGFRSGRGRRLRRIGVETERRHQNGIHRLSRRLRRERSIGGSLAFRWQWGGKGSNVLGGA
jgi:hypothetical protein